MQVTFQEVVGGVRELSWICAYVHEHAYVSKVSLCKKICGINFRQWHSLVKIGENFLLAKIPAYTVFTYMYMCLWVLFLTWLSVHIVSIRYAVNTIVRKTVGVAHWPMHLSLSGTQTHQCSCITDSGGVCRHWW